MKIDNLKKKLKKFWVFLWYEDSLSSWLVNIVLAFVLIKFIIYPFLGFILSTNYPIVAVVSGSMEHNGNFDEWFKTTAFCERKLCTQEDFYKKYNISKKKFLTFPFKNGFNKGDIMILKGVSINDLKEGDVIVFRAYRPEPIIHRIIDIKKKENYSVFVTKGDHNPKTIRDSTLDETNIKEEFLIGYKKYNKGSKAILRIPYLGYIKIWFVDLINFIFSRF